MSRPRLSPTGGALVMLGVATLGLMGVPGIGPDPGPEGALEGLCLDERGFAVPEARVALFDARSASLVEATTSDREGRFAFQNAPQRWDVFVQPPRSSGIAAAWVLDRSAGNTRIEVVLRRGRPLAVRALDERGRPVEGAEVRVYDVRTDPAVVAYGPTDGDGRATLLAPPTVDVSVHAPGRPVRWRHGVQVPQEGATYTFHLPEARILRGRVLGKRGPLAGAVVSSFQTAEPEGWNGYTVTDPEGRFELPVSRAATEVQVLDPRQAHLPRRIEIGPDELPPADWVLEPGLPLEVRTEDGFGGGIEARVWVWSGAGGTWSFGARTTPDGRLTTVHRGEVCVVAQPLHGARGPLEAWNLSVPNGRLVLGPETPDH